MKSIIKTTVLVATFVLGTTSVFAQTTKTANLAVTASVAANCVITAPTALDFGAWDPVTASAAQGEVTPGVVTVSCTKGTSATLSLPASGTMSNGAGGTIAFNLFKADGSTPWGSTVLSFAAGKAAQNTSVRGEIPATVANLDVPVGTYNGTVVASIQY
jgi:spore coat protein U-like protein